MSALARLAAATVAAAAMVTLTPTPTTAAAGCTSTWKAPESARAAECRAAGWTIRPRLVVTPRGYVTRSRLPHCTVEDGSSGPLPCTWNVGPGTDGNGRGLAYWLDRHDRTRYVWTHRPPLRHWATAGERATYGLLRTAQVRDTGTRLRVWMPDGARLVLDRPGAPLAAGEVLP